MNHLLNVAFFALSVLFAIWNAVAASRYLTYRRVAASAELTWATRLPWFYNVSLGIGFFLLGMTLVSVLVLRSPPLAVLAQALMAAYYTVSFPLSLGVRRGFYRSGIWTEQGFVPYRRVRSLSWLERPDTVLVVQTEGGALRQGYARLRVPGELRGEARRVLASHAEDGSIEADRGVLGLGEPERAAEERA